MTEEIKVYDRRIPEPEPTLPARQDSPNALIMKAMDKGYTPEFIEKMMVLAERNQATIARQAYFDAFANFKAKAPKLKRDKFNKFFGSWYTSLENLLNTYNPVLGDEGLSLTFSPIQQTDKSLTVEAQLTHRLGHTESRPMTVPIDQAAIGHKSGERSRNPIQDIRSTFTYVRSMAAEAILGVAGTEGTVDDDGNSSDSSEPSKFEQWEIKASEVCEAAKKPEDLIQWWPDNSAQIKKELDKAEAARIYDMIVKRKKELQSTEREPGSEG